MAKKKQEPEKKKKIDTSGVVGLVGSTTEQAISETLELNYMPYAMSVIVSRASPEIDGFKPSHRKLLYTMYKMGLLTGGRTKSANIVGQTMRLNPHGDAAIYETMVRLARGNETLLHPRPTLAPFRVIPRRPTRVDERISQTATKPFAKRMFAQTRSRIQQIRTRFCPTDLRCSCVKILTKPLGLVAFCALLRPKSVGAKFFDLLGGRF